MSINRSRSSSSKPPQTVTVYYWNRIILVIMLVLALAGILVWFIYGYGDSVTSPSEPVPGSTLADENQARETADAEQSKREAAATTTPADAPVFAPPEESSQPAEINAPTTTASSGSLPQQDQSADRPTDQVLDEPVSEESADSETPVAETPVTETPLDESIVDQSPSDNALVADEESPVTIDIRSDAILRASLARGLRDKEPVGTYEQTVSLEGESLITVYMFTQMRGYLNETIYHDWYLNDSRIARVAIKPWVSPMRASSSKKITPSMLGGWRVEVVDSNGSVLAVTRFEAVE